MAKETPVFIATDWVLAIKRWSKTWLCPKTQTPGSGIYFPNDGSNFNLEATDGKSALVLIKGDRNAPADPNKITLMLQIYGGRSAFESCPDEAYINVNPDYKGARFMTVDDYKATCTQMNVPIHQVSSLLDTYNQSKA